MEDVTFTNDRSMELSGAFLDKGGKGVVICSHFTGTKEIKHYYYLAKALANEGISSLRFDFSDCMGKSEGTCEDMRLTHQIRDVFAALDFMGSRGIDSPGLMGHSLGGTTAIVAAANDTRVNALVPVAALAKAEWETLFSNKVDEWKDSGYITFPSWKGGKIKIRYGFYTDLAKYDATRLIRAVEAPVRIIQPGDDEIVGMKNAEGLLENANEPKDLKIIDGADHMFREKKHEEEMISLCVEWFKKHL
jgi:alpha/beta superfamily hydrolase